jgi:hypothetical protein
VAHELPADPLRDGVGVPDAVGVHHDDEVGAGLPPDLLGVRPQRGGRVRGGKAVRDVR